LNLFLAVSYHISFVLAGFVNSWEDSNLYIVDVLKYPSNSAKEQPSVRYLVGFMKRVPFIRGFAV
jgi:hypothetical protein